MISRSRRAYSINRSLLITTLAIIILLPIALITTRSQGEYVYYGYVPPSTDIGNIDELINGEIRNYTPPPGTALLDIIGTEDNTRVSVIDISTGEEIASVTVNSMEKRTVFIPYGTYFKIISNKRIAAMLMGGDSLETSGFYPSTEGGFIGTDFVFIPFTVSDSYIPTRMGYNLLIMGLAKTKFKVLDSSGKWSASGEVDQQACKRYLLWCRVGHGEPARGAGNSMIFRLTTDDYVMVAAVTAESFMAVPAVTGGYVGKIFFALTYLTYDVSGGTAALIIVPCEPGKVTIYETSMDKIAEKTFTETDVAQDTYWFYKLGKVKKEVIIKSTGKITVLAGSTGGSETPENMGPDVSMMGIRPNELTKIFVPTVGVLFAPKDVKVTIDGVTQRLKRDQYVLLDSGVHSIKASDVVIVELICTRGTPWKWGTYLITPQDVLKSYEVPSGFGEKKGGISIWLIAGIIAVATVAVFVFLRRRGTI
ncbi:hypothetical protein DRJ17_06635 [Candidatus Woesearchaeota archaeon]|nr:MAG: hypothetical protein DRJ17_06635 [Candidatus Woesearchaeota archaeon]